MHTNQWPNLQQTHLSTQKLLNFVSITPKSISLYRCLFSLVHKTALKSSLCASHRFPNRLDVTYLWKTSLFLFPVCERGTDEDWRGWRRSGMKHKPKDGRREKERGKGEGEEQVNRLEWKIRLGLKDKARVNAESRGQDVMDRVWCEQKYGWFLKNILSWSSMHRF